MEIGRLQLGDSLGQGGQGQVTAVSGYLIEGQWPAVLKRYTPQATRTMRTAALKSIVAFPGQLPAHDSHWLHQNTAWPAVVAEDRGTVCGFLMRAVPSSYYFQFRTKTRGAQRKLADLAFLLNEDDYVSSSGIAISDQDRLTLLGSAAALLSRLHALGVVVGDFSPKNLLFSLTPTPNCFLIDCDAIRLYGDTVLDQVETPDWEVPAGEPKATAATDAYKFGLLAIRLFARDQSSCDMAAVAAVSPELGRLAQLSQHHDPQRRPTPGSWITALNAAAASASSAPTAAATAAQATATPPRVSVPIDTVTTVSTVRPPRPAPVAKPASAPRPARRRPAGPLLLVACVLAIATGIGAAIHYVNAKHASAAQTSSIGDNCLIGTWQDGNEHTSTTWHGRTVAMNGGGGDVDHISANGSDENKWGAKSHPFYGTYGGHRLKLTYNGRNTATISADSNAAAVTEDGWSADSKITFTYRGHTSSGYFGRPGTVTHYTYRCTARKLKWIVNNRTVDTETRISRNP